MRRLFDLPVLHGRVLLLLASTSLVRSVYAQASSSSNATCSFLGLFPFSVANNSDGPHQLNYTELGFSHLSAMRLAMDHLNNRDNSVVPNLSDLLNGCTLQFKDLHGFDTQLDYFLALEAIVNSTSIPDRCGVVGPYEYKAQIESTVLTAAMDLPQVLFTNGDTTDLTGQKARVTVGTNLGYDDYFNILMDYLVQKFGVEFLAMSTGGEDTAIEKAFRQAMNQFGIPEKNSPSLSNKDLQGLQALKKTGIRNIFLSLDDKNVDSILEFANALDANEMLNGKYFYILSGEAFRPGDLEVLFGSSQKDSNITKLLHGALWFGEVDPFTLDESDRFLSVWRNVDGASIAAALQLTLPDDKYFSTQMPFRLTSFVYDSVVALGLGNCLAQKKSGGSSSGRRLQLGEGEGAVDPNLGISNNVVRNMVQNVSFLGASGKVEFQLKNGEKFRVANGMNLAVYNVRAVENEDGSVSFESVRISQRRPGETWEAVRGAQFLFADASYNPPATQQYVKHIWLSHGIRAFGLSLFGIGCLLAIVCGGAITYLQGDALMKIAQPFFLKIICVGSFVENFTIFTLSFDGSNGWSDKVLSGFCVSAYWLFFLGHAIIYSAIFCKLWRVDRVMQARRQKVTHFQVMWPILFLFAGILTILIVWTVIDPWQWEDTEVEGAQPPESKGQCSSDHFLAFFWPCAVLIGLPTLLTIFGVWKTKDISQDLSDTSTTFYLVVTQFQAWLLGVPVMAVIGKSSDSSVDAVYLGRVLLIWIFAMAPILIVLTPRIYRTVAHRWWPESTKTRGSGVRVSGLTAPLKNSKGGSSTTSDSRNSATVPTHSATDSSSEKPTGGLVKTDEVAECECPPEVDTKEQHTENSEPTSSEEDTAVVGGNKDVAGRLTV